MGSSPHRQTPRGQERDVALQKHDQELEQGLQPSVAIKQCLQTDLYKALLQAQSDLGEGSLITDGSQILCVNEAFRKISGYNETELLALSSLNDLVIAGYHPLQNGFRPPEGFQVSSELLPQNGQKDVTQNHLRNCFKTAIRHKNGQFVELEVAVKAFAVEESSHLLIIARKLSRYEQIEALQISDQRFRATFEQAAVGMAHVGLEGQWLLVNQKLCDILGYSREELLLRTFQDITYPDDLDTDLGYVRQMLANNIQTYSIEKRYLHKSGSVVWANLTVSLVRKPSGEPDYFIAAIENIDERKQAEAELNQSLKELADLTSALDESSIVDVSDQHGIIQYVNDKFCEISQYSREELIGQDHQLLNSSYHSKQFIQSLWATIGQGKVWQGEIRNRAKDGSFYWVDTTIVPFLEPNKTPYQYVAIRTDVTSRKEAEAKLAELNADLEHQVRERTAQLERQMEELKQLNALKDDFLSTVSHELRTPMANIKMALRMLQVASTPQQQSRYLQILHNECAREINLINDLLDLQRLETGPQPLLLSALRLQSWLPELIAPFEERAKDRQQVLQLQISADLPPLLSDPASLERTLAELINNACKYSPPGAEIKVVARRSEHTPGAALIQVCNSGVVIPAREQNRIFEKFYRIPSADPWKQGGTGLGLALVQKLVQRLGGTIQVESTSELTTFSIELPKPNSLTGSSSNHN
ncbi:PAS domain S-box protein [Leptolyngbya sp. FACHB-261]|uniref:PAS domain-containing sensor histidine kinase n=1 Tax=Leptolyngbya sp. FACHB-261 TaxID=2692806 RepID=UPI001684A9B3|nr:PAS domain S-box protein [Leptolyngbya sp. FACHB-261]MBD2102231.1 PAS domain S-box protein [Leptolyngbya sp. FACHB-261]